MARIWGGAATAKSLQSCLTLCDSVRLQQPTRLLCPWDSPGKNTGVGCHFLLQCMKVKSESEVTQSYLTLSNPMDWSLPGSSVHGIFQARVLEWGAIAFSNIWGRGKQSIESVLKAAQVLDLGFKPALRHMFKLLNESVSKELKENMRTVQFSSVAQSCLTLCNPMNCSTPGLPVHHQLPEFTHTHVHQVCDTIQPSHSLCPFLLLPPIPPSIRVFSSESTLHMRWPKYWSFSFSISPPRIDFL